MCRNKDGSNFRNFIISLQNCCIINFMLYRGKRKQMKKQLIAIVIFFILLNFNSYTKVNSINSVNKFAKLKVTTYNSKKSSKSILLLDWWKSACKIFSTGTIAKVTDVGTGKSFYVKRTTGTNHADSEALSSRDTDIIKSIWRGFSWERRPVIITINGENIAASMSGMPHAGVDKAPALAYVNNRSDGYGSGVNYDFIKGNGMNGHFDIHFLHSTRHKDGKQDSQHQNAVMKAAQSKIKVN